MSHRRFFVRASSLCRLAILAALCSSHAAVAFTTRYVDDNHPAGCPGNGMIGSPYCSIQVAIDASVNGDEIIVSPGTYFELIDFNGKAIHLRSTDPNDPAVVSATIIDGNTFGTVVTCSSGEGLGTILDGFTITNGDGGSGGGMLILNSSPTVRDCVFDSNVAQNGGGVACVESSSEFTDCTFTGNEGGSDGGAMFIVDSNPTVTNCTFDGNSATRGAGIYNDTSGPTVTNCSFLGNTAASYGGGIFNIFTSHPSLTNCLFLGNVATAFNGGAMSNSAGCNPVVTNCTFTGNTAGGSGGAMENDSSSDPIVTNCILWGDSPDEIFNTGATSNPVVSYSNVQGGIGSGSVGGGGNINVNPYFLDLSTDDLHLWPFSPCIDAGNNSALPALILVDLDTNLRVIDDAGVADTGAGSAPIIDMGAYERQVDSLTIPGPICVPVDTPYIQVAINMLQGIGEIIVKPGTYNEVIDFNGKPAYLRGTDPSDPAVVAATIIDGSGLNNHVVTCVREEGSWTTLDGLTITGGDASDGGGMFIVDSFPTVSNCIFVGNRAARGGGIYIDTAHPRVTDCSFLANRASQYGGGIYNQSVSKPRVTNCRFVGNSAGINGGAMENDAGSDPRVTNCVFTENTANHGGAMENVTSGSPILTNCIFWANVGLVSSPEIFNDSASNAPLISYCVVQGGLTVHSIDRGGNVFTDPLFTAIPNDGGDGFGDDPATPLVDESLNDDFGDLRPLAGSPCIDAGDSLTLVLWDLTEDLGGLPRFTDDLATIDSGVPNAGGLVVDIGPYELFVPLASIADGTGVDDAAGSGKSPPPGAAAALATTRFVDDDNCPGPGDGSPGNPYCSIQDAIDASASGDEIIVQPGNYNELIDFNGKAVNLHSTDPIDPAVVATTIIDGTGLVGRIVTCASGEGSGTVLSGFTIDGGLSNADGGMFNENSFPTVSNCTFTRNVALAGAGIRNDASSPTVINCTFKFNFGSSAGGMYNDNGSTPMVISSLFWGHEVSSFGGGMVNRNGSDARVTNCTFAVNLTMGFGAGGMANDDGSSPRVTNCIFDTNVSGVPTDISNDGVGSLPLASYCNIEGGLSPNTVDGGGNISIDPGFVRAPDDGGDGWLDDFMTMIDESANNDYGDIRLAPGSPCIDAGDSTTPQLASVWFDLDGLPRIDDDTPTPDTGVPDLNGEVVDMGAFELNRCPTDSDDDGMIGVTDFLAVLAQWGPCPTPCSADSDFDGMVGILDFLKVLADWGPCP